MPINLNRLDVGPLAALAANRVGSLNLPLSSVDIGAFERERAKGLFQQAQLQNSKDIAAMNAQTSLFGQMMGNQNNLDVIRAQGENSRSLADLETRSRKELQTMSNEAQERLGAQSIKGNFDLQSARLSNDNSQNALTRQQQMALAGMDNSTKQAMLAQQQQESEQKIQIEKERLQAEKMQLNLKARASLDKDQRDMRGAASAAVLQYINSEAYNKLPPEKQQENLLKMQDMFIKKGIYSKEEAEQFLASSPQEQQTSLLADIGLNGTADRLAQITSFGKSKSKDGNFAPLSKPTIAKNEQDIQAGMDLLYKGQNLIAANKPEYYGRGLGEIMLGEAQQLVGYEGDAAKKAEARGNYLASARDYTSAALKMMGANVSNRTLSYAEPMSITGKEMDMGDANAKLQGMQEAAQAFVRARQLANEQGIPMDEAALQAQLKEISSKYSAGKSESGEGTYTWPGVGSNIKERDLPAVAKLNNMSVEDLRKHLKPE